jgi:hypothetical protein
MVWLVLGMLALLPLGVFVAFRRLARSSRISALLAAGVTGALLGAFLASAGSAMASAVHPSVALIKGGAVGFLGGTVVGGLASVVETMRALVLRRREEPF